MEHQKSSLVPPRQPSQGTPAPGGPKVKARRSKHAGQGMQVKASHLGWKVMLADDGQCFAQLCAHQRRRAQHEPCDERAHLGLWWRERVCVYGGG